MRVIADGTSTIVQALSDCFAATSGTTYQLRVWFVVFDSDALAVVLRSLTARRAHRGVLSYGGGPARSSSRSGSTSIASVARGGYA